MNLFALVFLFVVTLSLQFNELLSIYALMAVLGGLLFVRFIANASWRTALSAALVALLLVQIALRYELSHQPDPQWYGKPLDVHGTVEGIVQQRARGVRFVLKLDSKAPGSAQVRAKRIRLDWYGAKKQADEALQPGQVWALTVKLRQPGGKANPGGFDYAGWLFQRRIHAIGTVQKSPVNRLLHQQPAYQAKTRLWLAERLAEQGDGASHSGLMQALLVGLRDGITQSSNDLLRTTGTAHLLAISGLHIGMLAFWGYTLGTLVWRLLGCWFGRKKAVSPGRSNGRLDGSSASKGQAQKPGERRSNQIEFATVLSLLAAALYAWLAGFTLPTQRALIMLIVVFTLRLSRRHSAVLTPLSLALLLIVFNDPLAPLTAGFWLSFVSVLILLGISATGKGVESRWRQMARSHLLMGVLLFPLTAFFFGQASLVAPLANGVAIPFVSVFVVPLLFVWLMLTGVAPVLSAFLLQIVQFNLSVLLTVLELMRDWLPAEVTLQQLHPLHFGSFVCALLLVLLPQLRQWRILTLPLAVPFLWAQWSPVGLPGVQITTLSTGNQPLVVVQSGTEVVVAGLGGFYRGSGNRIGSVLLPFLRAKGIERIDYLVLPSAGVATGDRRYRKLQDRQTLALTQLREQVPVTQVIGDTQANCDRQWQAGLAGFSLLPLFPLQTGGQTPTTRPCALVMQAAGVNLVVLVYPPTLDRQLAEWKPPLLASASGDPDTILVLPAVASRKPAALELTQQIIDRLRPSGVVFAANHRSGAGFPPESRQMRYTLRGADSYRTDRDGAVEFSRLNRGNVTVQRFREQGLRPWH